jgi:hypothetical protein
LGGSCRVVTIGGIRSSPGRIAGGSSVTSTRPHQPQEIQVLAELDLDRPGQHEPRLGIPPAAISLLVRLTQAHTIPLNCPGFDGDSIPWE